MEEEVEEIVNVGKGAGKREKTKEEKKGRAKPAWQLEHEQQRAEKDKFRKKRGKAGKEKKMKQKYGDQDEEDRAAMMEFLGSAGAKKQSKKFQRAEKRELKKGGGARGQKKGPKEKKANTFERANEELPPPEVLPEDPDCKAEMVIEQMKEDADEEEITKMLEEEGFVDDDDISMLDQLTGKPTEEDLVHYAVPVVAPLSSLRDYKVLIV